MKNKLNKLIPLVLVSFLLTTILVASNVNAAETSLIPSGRLITDVNVVIKGYDGVDQSASLEQDYNASIPIVRLQADSFAAEDQNPTDFQTDGITRIFSDSMYSLLSTSTSTARGMYSVLQYIQEDSFAHYTIDQDVSVYTFTPIDSFYTTVNETMNNENVLWTAENFTVSEMYALVTFDRVMVDAFFADAMTEDGYGLLADTESTNQELIATVLDDVFARHCHDIIYAPVNTSLYYSDTWDIAQEVQSVMGGNATNTSVNGTLKIASIRDAMFGFMGQKIVPDSVIGQSLSAYVPDGPFSEFKTTATTYSFEWDIRTDYADSPLAPDLKFLLAILTDAEIEELKTAITWFWVENILWSLLGGFGLACIGLAATWKKPYRNIVGLGSFIVGFLLIFVILMFATAVV